MSARSSLKKSRNISRLLRRYECQKISQQHVSFLPNPFFFILSNSAFSLNHLSLLTLNSPRISQYRLQLQFARLISIQSLQSYKSYRISTDYRLSLFFHLLSSSPPKLDFTYSFKGKRIRKCHPPDLDLDYLIF